MLFRVTYPLSHVLLSTLLILQQAVPSHAAYQATACNNSPKLCNLSYGAITYLGTHNSPFLRDKSTSFSTSGNQHFDATVQLNAGVRLLQAQLHTDTKGGEPRLCHSSCSLMDAGTLGNWLSKIKTWMNGNPSEVVTLLIVNQDMIPAKELLPSFTTSDTASLAYVPSSSKVKIRQFPTLQEMIKQNKRLVVFITSGAGDASVPFLLNEWDYIWETKWENTDANAFSCGVDRPGRLRDEEGVKRAEKEGVVPLLNWFLYKEMGMGIMRPYLEVVGTTNGPSLTAGLQKCRDSDLWKALPPPRVPNYVLVDFFNDGNPIALIDSLNNVTDPVNRVKPPASPKGQGSPTGSIKGKSGGERVLDELLFRMDTTGLVPKWSDWILAGGDWKNSLWMTGKN